MAARLGEMGIKPNRNAPLPRIIHYIIDSNWSKTSRLRHVSIREQLSKAIEISKICWIRGVGGRNRWRKKKSKIPTKPKDNLLQAPNHYSSLTHATYLTDEHFRSCYSTSTRFGNFIKQSLQCRNAKLSYVHYLHLEDKKYREDKEAPEITEKEKK